jgi:hypothetical protein
MRGTRPIWTAALAGLALLLPLAAVTATPAAAEGGLQVALTAASSQGVYGREMAFTATVTLDGAPAADLFVQLVRTGADGVETFTDFRATDSTGRAPLTDAPTARATYVAQVSDETGAMATSAPVSVDVTFAVTPAVSPVAIPPGGRISVTGTVQPAVAGQPVTVEERFGTGAWRVLGSVPVGVGGSWTFALGTRSKVGTWTVRASVPGDALLSPGVAESSAVVTVTGAGRAAAWRPIAGTRANPARWGTCRIGYRVNALRMPPTGLADLREAMRRVTQVSGIRFRFRGKTTVVPRPGYGGPGLNQMVVAWASPRQSRGLVYPGVSGVGGTSQSRSRLLSGYVLINTQFSGTADPGFAEGASQGLVLMHELGHVVGLDHSPNRRQIMYFASALPAAVWGAADIRGLRKVGSRCR